VAIAGHQWHLPINGTRSSKATITTQMTQVPKALFTYTGTCVAGREHSNESPRDGCQ
jgi:hypothetical protein